MNLDPMELLDEMIQRGWGSVPRTKIPEDWRERTPPATASEEGRRSYVGAVERRERHAAKMFDRNAQQVRRGPIPAHRRALGV